ncbi:MAG TPA: hypothetical protein VFU05_04475 [Cyclobacteriaceae bacterium]|nr:hypothetical protein [Cyclobacteriaceae bacterium]
MRSTLTTFLGISMLIYSSCSEEPDEPEPKKEEPPAVLDSKIFKQVFPAKNATLSIKDSVVVFFNEKNGKKKTIDNINYRAIIDQVTLDGVTTTDVWASDSLSVVLYPKDMLLSNTSFTVTVKTHWEVYKNAQWIMVAWEGVELRENEISSFTTGSPEMAITPSNLKYMYPIPNQYHFLVEEHPAGFVRLNRGQKSLFSLSGYTYAAVFKKLTGETIESEVTYNNDNDQINFDIPQTLATETIYRLQIVARQTGTSNVTTLVDYHFRTSKYRNFTAKFNAMTYGSTFSVLMAPWSGHYIRQAVSTAGEYFDSFESEVKTVAVELGNPATVYNVPYACNLVRIEAVMPGNTWYDNGLYPKLYAPWTEPNFKPTVARDTSIVGYPPVRAMSMYNLGTGTLTPQMIETNSSPAITGSSSAILHSLSLIIWKDFQQIQAQVVQKYINLNTIPARENAIIFGSMPVISNGTFRYKVKYTLPSGQVTTTLDKSMILP